MKFRIAVISSTLAALFFMLPVCLAALDWNVIQAFNLKDPPLDVAFSTSRNKVFVLTDKGQIQVYEPNGTLDETMDVGQEFDRIWHIQGSDVLVLSSREKKSVQIVELNFVEQIDTSGSPFRGPENAPVVVAVFSEFE
ncbi:MAG: hypothetical protein U5R30_21825 [Deltaproteobacteria bacterium]|nr:hypothetical protein [Deltaproteobacteria bacterium]